MSLDEIIMVVGNRLETLRSQRTLAVTQGDLTRVAALDAEVSETEATLTKLRTLLQ
jgi:hypothetical protein